MGKDGTSCIVSMNRKVDISVLTNTKYTDGIVALPIGFKTTLEHVSNDGQANRI